MRRVFGVRGYRRLLAAYALNEIAWSVGSLALAVVVYGRTRSALASTAFFLASQFLPALVSPALVARVDGLRTPRVLAALYAAQAALFAVLAAAQADLPLGPILGIVAVAGAIGLAARPIVRATATGLLAPGDLVKEGNAVANAAFAVCLMLGPILGGVLASHGRASTALSVVVGIFLCATLVFVGAGHLADGPGGAADGRRGVRAAITVARQDPVVRGLLAFQAVALVFFSVSIPVEVILAQHTLKAGASGYGALLSAWGSGAIVGSVVYARTRERPGWLLIGLSSVSLGVGFLIMAIAPTLLVAVVGAAIGGLGNGVEAVAEQTVLQERVEPRWLPLTLSLNGSIFQAFPGIGFVLGGVVAATAGPRAAFAVGAAGALVVGVVAPVVLRPSAGSEAAPERAGTLPAAPGEAYEG
jgi:MFS family permease